MIKAAYPESVQESEKYLRTALQKIAKTQIPYNPISYLMWYDYATGRDEQLIKDMELLLNKDHPLDFDMIINLHNKHMVDNKVTLAEHKTWELHKILTEITKQLSVSSSGIANQGNILDTYAAKLTQATSLDAVTEITNNIVLETKSVVESSKILTNQLDSAKSEVNVLTQELEELKKTAKTDMLTSLLNRHGFDENISLIMEDKETPHEPLSVIMIDIDHFKKVNDTYGHLVGDSVLKKLGALLKKHIKGQDIAARFGGEEFILVLPQTPIKGAYVLAEQIRSSTENMKLKIKKTGKSIDQITISLGIALLKSGESIETAIKKSDDALYHAKNTGRNKIVTEFDDEN